MFRNSVEFLPSFQFLEVPRSNYNDICDLVSFIIDSPSTKIFLLKLPGGLGTPLNFEFSGSLTEKRILDHLTYTPNELLQLCDIANNPEIHESLESLSADSTLCLVVAPLQDSTGEILGIMCLYDHGPRTFTDRQKQAIMAVANQTVSLIASYQEIGKTESAKTFVDNKNFTLGNYLDTNGTASWKLDLQSGNLWLSSIFFEMLGYTPAELHLDSLENWIDLVYFFDHEKFKNSWRNWSHNDLLENDLECRMIHKSGDIIFVNIEISNSKTNDAGELIFFEGEVQDITTQIMVWEQIDLINPNYTSVIQAGYNWLAIIDLEGNYIFSNTTLESALGYSSEELMGHSIFGLIHEDECEKVTSIFSKFLRNEPFVSRPFRYRHKNGTWKWIEILLINLLEDPMIQGVVVNARDITERVLINKEIKASEEKHRLLFNSSPHPKYILELGSCKIIDVNDAMTNYYGYSREEFLTMTAKELRPKEEIGNLMMGLEEFQHQKETLNSGIYIHKKKNGDLAKIDIVGQHISINGAKCVLVTCSDVTEKAQYLNDLKQSEIRLKKATGIAKLGYWSLDLQNMALSFSEEVYNIWERDKDSFDFNFDNIVTTIHPDDREYFIKENQSSISRNKIYDISYRIILPDNSIKWVHLLGQPIFEIDGSPNKFEGTVQDITQQKKEEQNLRLLESVVINANDAVLITAADPIDGPGPRIIYVNDAFTKMTGYTADEVIGKTRCILQGPKSDKTQLEKLNKALRCWKPCEITLINYKKNGEEFWVNFSLNPIADEKGCFTHWISIERDVTYEKNQEFQKNLLIDISVLFGIEKDLKPCLVSVLNYLVNFGQLALGEIWLINSENTHLKLFASSKDTNIEKLKSGNELEEQILAYGNGLAGSIWEYQKTEVWDKNNPIGIKGDSFDGFSELDKVVGLPMIHNEKFIGALIIGLDTNSKTQTYESEPFLQVANHLAAEIKRKLVEIELENIFNFAPDILCKAGNDGYFKKINPATSKLLGYSEKELLSRKIIEFVHPEDREKTINQQNYLYNGKSYKYFENRYIHKSGETIWLSWTARPSHDEGVVYAVAKDITENKALKNLLHEVTDLALIGAWELNFRNAEIYWSEMTKKIHEEDSNFSPTVESVLAYYQNGETREIILSLIENAVEKGESWDLELQITTAKGNDHWVRMIGKPEFINDECIRIFGSFQDINDLKTSQIKMEKTNEEKNSILESIGDAFISVDDAWTVTYWNNMAEQLFLVHRADIIGKNIWIALDKIINVKTFLKYYKTIKTGGTAYFQEYFTTINKWLEVSAYHSENTFSLYIRDITEKRQSQMAVEKQNTKLREIAWTQSHVVRAPLARLMGIIDLFHENLVNDNEKIKLLDNVYCSAIELDAIIQDIVKKSQSVISDQNPWN